MTANRADDERHSLSSKTVLVYVLPALCVSIMVGPAASIIQGIYTRDLGLKLSDIASLILIARVLDALTDPAIGYLSDKTRHHLLGRKPWLIAGACLSLLGIWFLYFPPANVSATYFFFAFVISMIGWTVIEIPHLAWGTEIAGRYDERSKLFSFRFGAVFGGTFIFLAIPIGLAVWNALAEARPFALDTEYDRGTLAIAFWMVAAGLPLATIAALWRVPAGVERPPIERQGFFSEYRDVVWNRPFRSFAIVMAAFGIATGMQMGVAYLHLSSYLGLASSAPIIYITCIPLNLLSIPGWLWAAKRWGKHRAFAFGGLVCAGLFVLLGFITPGPSVFWSYLGVFALLQLSQGAWYALPPAILSDIADYGELKTGSDSTGAYFASFVFITKCTQGLGTGLGFAIAALFAFDPALDVQTESAAIGLKLVMGFLPAAIVGAASIGVFRFPITRARHDMIRRGLAKRMARLANS